MRAIAAGIVAGVVVAATVVAPRAPRAQPDAPRPLGAPEVARARDLYRSAEDAMKEGRFADAARDYGAAYEITKDPVLFFKLGGANDRGKKCNVALIYYRRYLREAHPTDEFARLTRFRIAACGGDPNDLGAGSATGSAPPPVGSGSDEGSGSVSEPEPDVATLGSGGSGSGSGSATAPVAGGHRLAWILVGSSIAAFTVGAVCAYSANASESDIKDLYVGLDGTPPVFDSKTKAKLDDLVHEGRRYQHLSWLSFGVAGGLAIAAAVRFVTDSKSETVVTPIIAPNTAGASATFHF
jgi:hypothetical protein